MQHRAERPNVRFPLLTNNDQVQRILRAATTLRLNQNLPIRSQNPVATTCYAAVLG
ncbi:MAG: hypothetical protein ACRC8A_05420 [Microcoleaceae cyanobacterium]